MPLPLLYQMQSIGSVSCICTGICIRTLKELVADHYCGLHPELLQIICSKNI